MAKRKASEGERTLLLLLVLDLGALTTPAVLSFAGVHGGWVAAWGGGGGGRGGLS
jgi:hypothetical protein